MTKKHENKKVAIVTGASGGIGSEIAKRLAADGISIIANYSKSSNAAQEVVNSIISSGGDAYAIQADITNVPEIQKLFQFAKEKYGQIDIVINNAGTVIASALTDITENIYHEVFDVNVKGALFVLKESAHYLNNGGRIINTSSTIVSSPIPGSAIYTASKAALESFSQVLAKELGMRGITVNSIRVGPTIPGMFSKAPPEIQAAAVIASPFKRLGTPKDVADVVAFLVSENACWITGQNITIDGGAGNII